MPITVVSEANGSKLTTVDALAEQLQLSSSEKTSQNNRLEALIDRASDFTRMYTGRVFAQETVKETLVSPNTLPGMGGFRLVLSRTPIVEIIEMTHQNDVVDNLDEAIIEDAEAGFIFYNKRFNSTTIYTGPITYQPSRYGKYDWEIEYKAGYILPGEDNRDFPFDLEQAVVDIAKSQYFTQGQDNTVRREQIGQSEIEYAIGSSVNMVPKAANIVLDHYKRTYS